MSDEAVKELASALKLLADAINKLGAGSFGGIQVHHHGLNLTPLHHPQLAPQLNT